MRAVLDDPLDPDHRSARSRTAQIEHLLTEVSGRTGPAAADHRRRNVARSGRHAARHAADRDAYLVVNPPEYGHWRKAMLEDLAILTGGRVIARDLGGRLEQITLEDLGAADRVKTSRPTPRSSGATATELIARPPRPGAAPVRGRPAQYRAGQAARTPGQALGRHRRSCSRRRHPGRAEADHPADRGRLNAVRAASEEGVVAGGGSALTQARRCSTRCCGRRRRRCRRGRAPGALGAVAAAVAHRRQCRRRSRSGGGRGHAQSTAATATTRRPGVSEMFQAGIIDPVRVTYTALPTQRRWRR